jgi:DNA-binding NtrC family response regulator
LKTRKRIVLVNITGTALTSLCDLLDLWGYAPVNIESAEMISADPFAEPPALLLFQFLEFSEEEYASLNSISAKAPGIPVVATSPFISIKEVFRVARAGVADYLTQPYSPPDLRQMIEKYLDSSSAARANRKGVGGPALGESCPTASKAGQDDSINTCCGPRRSIHVSIGSRHWPRRWMAAKRPAFENLFDAADPGEDQLGIGGRSSVIRIARDTLK